MGVFIPEKLNKNFIFYFVVFKNARKTKIILLCLSRAPICNTIVLYHRSESGPGPGQKEQTVQCSKADNWTLSEDQGSS